MFKSIFSRLMITYFVIILITLIVVGVLLSSFFQNLFFQKRAQELEREAIELNPFIEMYAAGKMTDGYLYSYFKVADRYKNTTVWVIDDMGYIWLSYSSSNEDKDKWKEQQLTVNEFIQVKSGKTITKIGKFGERFQIPVLTVGVPLRINNKIRGAIFLHSPVEEINSTLKDVYKNIWLAAFFSAIISIVFLYITSKIISKPVIQMNQITREFALGNFDRRVNVTHQDEIGQLAVNFNAMADSLQKLEDMRRSFVANVSHELRSPLTSIRGYIQGVLDKTIQPEDMDKYLGVALYESNRLNKLINELLNLSQIESGQFPLKLTSFDINEVIRRVLISQEEKIVSKDMNVKIDFQNENCYVVGDIDRLQQVVHNIIDNAVKFNRQQGKLYIKSWKYREKVYVKIQDEGPGIPKDEIMHIWERFYQVDKSRSSQSRGTGLGLSIVKKIIEEHGQNIWVNSQVGKGTAFIFSLDPSKKM